MADAARRDLVSIQSRIGRDSPSAARKWLREAQRRVKSLGWMAESFEVIDELADDDFGHQYRHYLFGNYRIIYRVEETRVLVARIIYATRILTPRMLEES